MQGKLNLAPKILLIVCVLALVLIVKHQNEIKEFLGHSQQMLGVFIDNFFFEVGSGVQRKRPISLEKKQVELQLYIGEPFRSFGPEDWKVFWEIIYGGYLKPDPERPDLPKRKRQLTEDEIIAELTERYPTPFVLFNESHWQAFFEVINKK